MEITERSLLKDQTCLKTVTKRTIAVFAVCFRTRIKIHKFHRVVCFPNHMMRPIYMHPLWQRHCIGIHVYATPLQVWMRCDGVLNGHLPQVSEAFPIASRSKNANKLQQCDKQPFNSVFYIAGFIDPAAVMEKPLQLSSLTVPLQFPHSSLPAPLQFPSSSLRVPFQFP